MVEVAVDILTTAVAVVVTDGNSKLIYFKKELNLLSSFFMPENRPIQLLKQRIYKNAAFFYPFGG